MEQEVELLEGETRETIVTTEPTASANFNRVTTTVVDTHVVAPGETLSEITYDKTGDGTYDAYMEVAEANNIENPHLIYPGDEIKYTVSETTQLQRNPDARPAGGRPTAVNTDSQTQTNLNPTTASGAVVGAAQGAATAVSTAGATTAGTVSPSGTASGGAGGTLGIERATIGYDKVGLQNAVNALNLIVFNGASTLVQNAKALVHIAVDQCWAGQAADAFKAKFDRDADTMSKTLESLEEEIKSQFAQMAKNIDNYDQDIADSIDSMK